MAPVLPTPGDPGPSDGPRPRHDNMHIIAYAEARTPEDGVQTIPPAVQEGNVDKSHELTGIPSELDDAVDTFLDEMRHIEFSVDLLKEIRDHINQVLIPGPTPPAAAQPEAQLATHLADLLADPRAPQDDAPENPHIAAVQNLVQAVYHYAETSVFNLQERQDQIHDILSGAGGYVWSIRPGCLVSAIIFEKSDQLLDFLSQMHRLACKVMQELVTPLTSTMYDSLVEAIESNFTRAKKAARLCTTEFIASVIRHICVAIAVPDIQLLNFLNHKSSGGTAISVDFTIMLRLSHTPHKGAIEDSSAASFIEKFREYPEFKIGLQKQVFNNSGAYPSHSKEKAVQSGSDAAAGSSKAYSKVFINGLQLEVFFGGDIFQLQCDIIVNSIGEKRYPTDNVLAIGSLARKMAARGGDQLVEKLADPRLKWIRGESFVTPAFGLYKGEGTPSHIFHCCLPKDFTQETYATVRTLFSCALEETHTLNKRTIGMPLIGTGFLNYPPGEVMKALMDACSLFRQKDSTLKLVKLVAWNNDPSLQKIQEDEISSELKRHVRVTSSL